MCVCVRLKLEVWLAFSAQAANTAAGLETVGSVAMVRLAVHARVSVLTAHTHTRQLALQCAPVSA